jgi:hypothetical protein
MSKPSGWKFACTCAVSDGVPQRSLYLALIVGTILNVNNQGDALISFSGIDWLKIALTYCVPYAVCTYGAVSARLAQWSSGIGNKEQPQCEPQLTDKSRRDC